MGRTGVQGEGGQQADDVLHACSNGPGTMFAVRPTPARKNPSFANLHIVRIRIKDLRYGCNTVALVEGGPARKTARAAERLQVKLGDLHDAFLFHRMAAGAGRGTS